jgi:hypothetical protein
LLCLVSYSHLVTELLLKLLTEFVDLHGPGLVLLLGAFPALGTIFKHVLDEHLDTGGYWGHTGFGGEFVNSSEGLNDLVLNSSVDLFGLLNTLG